MIRICVDANILYPSIPTLLNIRPTACPMEPRRAYTIPFIE